jgi:para-aminobenzoate synthetase component 1
MRRAGNNTAEVLVETLGGAMSTDKALLVTAQASEPAILESSLHTGQFHRFSIFASDPIDEFRVDVGCGGDPFADLGRRCDAYPRTIAAEPTLPFCGGWIGYFSYEMGAATQGINNRHEWDLPLPLAQFYLYDTALILDHESNEWLLVAVDWPTQMDRRRAPGAERIAALRHRLQSLSFDRAESAKCALPATYLSPAMSVDEYRASVIRAKRYIEAGDVYQVNLTQRFTAQTSAQPITIYERLRQCNPSSHAALLPWSRGAIISASPELFLELRGDRVVTRPIKGTRPRSGVAEVDAAHRLDLLNSEKDRAELTMIIDLLRNDLGRVCALGSVNVVNAGEIEEHPTVLHRTATVEGRLSAEFNWQDLMRASFPGGSITGAPKIRAMQIIDELEATCRGVYCGSIGLIGLDGSISLNIAIRTMVHTGSAVFVNAGGAILAESDAVGEYEEMMAKAAGMIQALGCPPQSAFGPIREATA